MNSRDSSALADHCSVIAWRNSLHKQNYMGQHLQTLIPGPVLPRDSRLLLNHTKAESNPPVLNTGSNPAQLLCYHCKKPGLQVLQNLGCFQALLPYLCRKRLNVDHLGIGEELLIADLQGKLSFPKQFPNKPKHSVTEINEVLLQDSIIIKIYLVKMTSLATEALAHVFSIM